MTDTPKTDEYGDKILSVSWSRLYTYNKCQQKARFAYDGKGAEIKDLRNFIHGTLADLSMRKWLDQTEEQKPGQMAQYVDDFWDEIVLNSPEGKVVWRGDPLQDKERVRHVAKTVVTSVEPFLLQRVIPYEYEPELRFSYYMKIPDSKGFARTIRVNGGADIVVRKPDGTVWVYDLKATTNENYITAANSGQLIFYQLAMNKILGVEYDKIFAAYLTPFTKKQYHELTISKIDRQHMLSSIIKYANFIWDNEEPTYTKDKNECYWCTCKAICALWSTQLSTLQNDGKNRVSIVDTAQTRKQAKEEMNNNE